jgi:hypothetical protein
MFEVPEAPQLKGLADELDSLALLDAGALDGASSVALVVEGRRMRDRLDAMLAHWTAAYVAEGSWQAAGFRSPAAHLASLRGEPGDACLGDVRLARALRSMPLTAQALAAGSLTRAHAERLRIAAGGPRAAAFADAETTLVAFAGSLDGPEFERAVRYRAQVADDAGAEDEARRHDRGRYATVEELLDGRVDVRATMTRTAGAEFAEALQRITDELFEADWARARERWGREPIEAELGRTAAQRRHDALVVMARRAMASWRTGRWSLRARWLATSAWPTWSVRSSNHPTGCGSARRPASSGAPTGGRSSCATGTAPSQGVACRPIGVRSTT